VPCIGIVTVDRVPALIGLDHHLIHDARQPHQ
jgi:chemotaxis receptor (MCP) glutamine deamidase CheD